MKTQQSAKSAIPRPRRQIPAAVSKSAAFEFRRPSSKNQAPQGIDAVVIEIEKGVVQNHEGQNAADAIGGAEMVESQLGDTHGVPLPRRGS